MKSKCKLCQEDFNANSEVIVGKRFLEGQIPKKIKPGKIKKFQSMPQKDLILVIMTILAKG